jgi:4-azaleucine resistance transporter AzlC
MKIAINPTFSKGVVAAWPICLGYAPIGLAFGVLAEKAGLSPLEIGLMSVIVFAGSSQFIAVSMLAAGASALSIVATAFVVNLRHFLMSSALAVYLKNSDRKKLTFFPTELPMKVLPSISPDSGSPTGILTRLW